MIIGESMQVPRESKKLLRLTAEELQKNYNRRTYHFKESGSGLVVAEGEAQVRTLTKECTVIGALPGKFYAYAPNTGVMYPSDYSAAYSIKTPDFQLLRYFNAKGGEEVYCVTQPEIKYLGKYEATALAGEQGGSCAAVFHDRIFMANGFRVNYSRALNGLDWEAEHYGPGFIELFSDEMGEIVSMLPYKDKLYLLRRHGITYLRALGDELNFKAVHMPMKCGSLVDYSAALCGEHVGYFTDCGFYLFNGATSVLAPNSRCGEIDLTAPVKAFTHCGKYYALVTKKEGGRTIYCYDPQWCEGYFIGHSASDIAVGDDVYFVRDATVYRLTGRGLPQNGMPYLTAEGIALSLDGEKWLRSLLIEGEGTFSVTVSSSRGSRTVEGAAGKILKLRSPLRGNGFGIKISAAGEDAEEAKFQAVQLSITEESNDN